MGLRQKSSLRRTHINHRNDLNERSETSSPRKSKTARRPAMKLVSKNVQSLDPNLDEFLDPQKQFEPPLSIPLGRPDATPTRVAAAVNMLGKLESAVLAALFPPSGEPPASIEEISEELGMSTEEVKNIADEALRGLRGGSVGGQRVSKAWN
jgi:hypothetical protein